MQHLQQSSPHLAAATLPSFSEDSKHESLTARPHSPTQLSQNDSSDLLARTAGELLQNVSQDLEGNTKFRNSSFMELMRKLRDKETKVEGNEMVETKEPAASASHQSAQQLHDASLQNMGVLPSGTRSNLDPRSVPVAPVETEQPIHTLDELQAAYAEMNATLDDDQAQRSRRAFQGDGGYIPDVDEDDQAMLEGRDEERARWPDTAVAGATAAWEEDFDPDNSLLRSGPQPPTMEQILQQNPQQNEWAHLQDQWDSNLATSSGLQRTESKALAHEGYRFQKRNPYLRTQQHSDYLPADTLLAREADVQNHPNSPQAWLNLGLKQQENEREPSAIKALLKALELDPQLKDAWLALAVSYTNDNIRGKAYDAIERWVDCKSEYGDLVKQYRVRNPSGDATSTNAERHQYLSNLLVDMARAGGGQDHQIDADVQIALGVMFNASEEYEKATDCFMAALSVRPSVSPAYTVDGGKM